jgi:hypothetical protein
MKKALEIVARWEKKVSEDEVLQQSVAYGFMKMMLMFIRKEIEMSDDETAALVSDLKREMLDSRVSFSVRREDGGICNHGAMVYVDDVLEIMAKYRPELAAVTEEEWGPLRSAKRAESITEVTK